LSHVTPKQFLKGSFLKAVPRKNLASYLASLAKHPALKVAPGLDRASPYATC